MKHLLTMLPIAFLSTQPAIAAIECIDLTPPDNVNSQQIILKSGSDWIIQIPVGSQTQRRIQGIAACSATKGSTAAAGSTATSLTMYPATSNIYCWCKMTWPALSNWVSVGYSSSWSTNYATTDACLKDCANRCADNSRYSTMVNKYKETIDSANSIQYF